MLERNNYYINYIKILKLPSTIFKSTKINLPTPNIKKNFSNKKVINKKTPNPKPKAQSRGNSKSQSEAGGSLLWSNSLYASTNTQRVPTGASPTMKNIKSHSQFKHLLNIGSGKKTVRRQRINNDSTWGHYSYRKPSCSGGNPRFFPRKGRDLTGRSIQSQKNQLPVSLYNDRSSIKSSQISQTAIFKNSNGEDLKMISKIIPLRNFQEQKKFQISGNKGKKARFGSPQKKYDLIDLISQKFKKTNNFLRVKNQKLEMSQRLNHSEAPSQNLDLAKSLDFSKTQPLFGRNFETDYKKSGFKDFRFFVSHKKKNLNPEKVKISNSLIQRTIASGNSKLNFRGQKMARKQNRSSYNSLETVKKGRQKVELLGKKLARSNFAHDPKNLMKLVKNGSEIRGKLKIRNPKILDSQKNGFSGMKKKVTRVIKKMNLNSRFLIADLNEMKFKIIFAEQKYPIKKLKKNFGLESEKLGKEKLEKKEVVKQKKQKKSIEKIKYKPKKISKKCKPQKKIKKQINRIPKNNFCSSIEKKPKKEKFPKTEMKNNILIKTFKSGEMRFEEIKKNSRTINISDLDNFVKKTTEIFSKLKIGKVNTNQIRDLIEKKIEEKKVGIEKPTKKEKESQEDSEKIEAEKKNICESQNKGRKGGNLGFEKKENEGSVDFSGKSHETEKTLPNLQKRRISTKMDVFLDSFIEMAMEEGIERISRLEAVEISKIILEKNEMDERSILGDSFLLKTFLN